jgi:hypothetical protein
MTFPQRPHELTPGWLTACLRDAGVLREASVTGLDVEEIGVGHGFAGRLFRLRLRYDRAEPGAPPTLIGKFAAEHATTRELMTALDGYAKEVRFYRELAAMAEMPTPRCYFAHHDVPTQTCLLLLEDLAPAAAVDLAAGLSVEQARLLLEHLARMHARFWGRTEGLQWLGPTDDVVYALRHHYLAALAGFAGRFGDRYPHLVRVARQLGWLFRGEEMMWELRRPPQTVTHGDLHLENLLFPTGRGGRLAVVDWQSVMLSRYGAGDVTRVLTMGLAPDVRRAHEDALLRHYHAALEARGVRGYSLRALKRRYRQEMAAQVFVAVVASDALDFGAERGEMFTALFGERLNTALADLRTDRLLAWGIAMLWPVRPFYNAYLALTAPRGNDRRVPAPRTP